MIANLLTRLFGAPEEINGGTRCPTYLYRWTLLQKHGRFSIYLRHFVADDWSRGLHDHPKRFISIGLWGWYIEDTPTGSRDRCTKAHEYLFLLSKSKRYYYDLERVKEAVSGNAHRRGNGVNPKCAGWAEGPGSHAAKNHAKSFKDAGRAEQGLRDSTKFGRGPRWRNRENPSFGGAVKELVDTRNLRSVWTIPTEPFTGGSLCHLPDRARAAVHSRGQRGGWQSWTLSRGPERQE